MWTNQLKLSISREEPAFVAHVLEFPSADVAEYMGLLGFDAVLIDGEHAGVDPLHAREVCRAVTAGGATPLIRVPYNDPNVILGYLDAGAHGIIVPHVCTAADAEAMVRACRYPPLGTRGAAAASRSSLYGTGPSPREMFDNANREVMAIPLLEDVEAIENLGEITAVEGVDAFFVGAGDLAMSMGATYGEARVVAVVEDAVRQITAAGRVAMTAVTTPEEARRAVSLGVSVVSTQPFALFRKAARDWLSDAKRG